jgi:hypothetical protein
MTLSPKILAALKNVAAANEDSKEEAAASRGPDEGTSTERDARPQVIPEPPDEYLRRDVRARLYGHRLFAAMGISSVRRGSGRPCIVCESPINSPTLEREVEGPGVFGLAHPVCYAIWREESIARHARKAN